MKDKFTRKKFLPFLSGGLFIPFFGAAKATTDKAGQEDQPYQSMLTKDGRIVKVRSKAVADSRIVDKQMSNGSLLKWLKKKDNI